MVSDTITDRVQAVIFTGSLIQDIAIEREREREREMYTRYYTTFPLCSIDNAGRWYQNSDLGVDIKRRWIATGI